MSMKWKMFLMGVMVFAFASFANSGLVSYYGKLQVNGNKLVGSKTGPDKPVQLRGVSLGWSNITWETARFFNENTVNAMVDHWKAELIRVPLGIGNRGFMNPGTKSFADSAANKALVIAAIEAAIAKDVYVVIDWHSHSADTCEIETGAAQAFFEEIARVYGSRDHVIFELYNEPLNVPWTNIKAYAEKVIPEIRKHSANLILVGTRHWCQRPDEVTAANAINDENVAYVMHFYAHSHALTGRTMRISEVAPINPPTFREAVISVINSGLPLFISEWGTTHADGGSPNNNFDTHNAANSNAWMAFLDSLKISSAAWNVNNKHEGSAFFRAPTQNGHPWNATTNSVPNWPQTHFTDTARMSPSGAYIYNLLNKYAETAEWRNPSSSITHLTPTRNSANAGWSLRRVDGGLRIKGPAATNGRTEAVLYDIRGRLIRKVPLNVSASEQTAHVGNLKAPAGNYIIVIRNVASGSEVYRARVSSVN